MKLRKVFIRRRDLEVEYKEPGYSQVQKIWPYTEVWIAESEAIQLANMSTDSKVTEETIDLEYLIPSNELKATK